MKKTALFDLDGTLLDSVTDLATVCNEVLCMYDLKPHPVERYKEFVGNGAAKLIERAAGGQTVDPVLIERMLTDYRRIYPGRCKVLTKPFDGVPELLRLLREKGASVGVLSNKPHAPTVDMVEHYFPGLVNLTYGQREDIPLKPDPASLIAMIGEMDSDAAHCVYVGDSRVDVWTAQNAGVPCLSVSWGTCTKKSLQDAGAVRIVDKVSDLGEIIIDILQL